MKPIYLIIIVIALVGATLLGYKIYHRSQLSSFGQTRSDQSGRNGSGEGQMPSSGDLCGSTGGIGEIISMGKNTITLKLKDGKNLVTHLTSQTTIQTSTGSASEADLKIGDRVTLVGGPNPDKSFKADTVLVCK